MSQDQAPRGVMAEVEGRVVLPFYLACDVSLGMLGDLSAINSALGQMRRAVLAEPGADDAIRFAMVTFSDIAKVVLPLGQLSDQALPALSAEGGTNYGAAFRELARVIAQDTAELKERGWRVVRPCVFFLTDGMPLDQDWEQSFTSALCYDPMTETGMKGHPVFLPFGFRDASGAMLRRLAYPAGKARWYHAKVASLDRVLADITGVITRTMVTSALSASAGRPALLPQVPPPGTALTHGDRDV
jgi:uncharacterized protein YegL